MGPEGPWRQGRKGGKEERVGGRWIEEEEDRERGIRRRLLQWSVKKLVENLQCLQGFHEDLAGQCSQLNPREGRERESSRKEVKWL